MYFLKFVDDYMPTSFVYFLKSKSGMDRRVRNFIKFVERQTKENVKRLSVDNKAEHYSTTLTDYLELSGIVSEKNAIPCNRTVVQKR